MKIVAFDPSLSSTGVWVDRTGQSYSIRTDAKESRFDRLAKLYRSVGKILSKERPEIVAVENYAYGITNSKSITAQAEVGGIIRALARVMGAQVVEVATAQWKNMVLGSGAGGSKKTKADRALYIGMVKAITGKQFETTDEADAYMIAEYVKRVMNGEAKTEAARSIKRVLEKSGE